MTTDLPREPYFLGLSKFSSPARFTETTELKGVETKTIKFVLGLSTFSSPARISNEMLE